MIVDVSTGTVGSELTEPDPQPIIINNNVRAKSWTVGVFFMVSFF
jgi:hypothetical protein